MRQEWITHDGPMWSVDGEGDDCILVNPCPCCEATTLTVQVGSATVGYRLEDVAALEGLRDCLAAAIEHHRSRTTPLESDMAGSHSPAARRGEQRRGSAGSRADRRQDRKTRRKKRGS
jgi:hypothetical protein